MLPQTRSQFFDIFFKGKPKDEFIAVRAIKGKNDILGSWYYPTVGESCSKIAKIDKKCNIYFGVCSRSDANPRKHAVATGYAVWADLDLNSRFVHEKEKILDSLDLLFEPSIVIDSGNGLHLYWLLDEPTTDLDKLERTNRNLGLSVGGDEVFDRTRIMRVPMTLNVKSDRELQVDIVRCSEMRYALNDLFAASCIEPKIVSRILSGSCKGFKSRSHRDWSVVTALVKCGASDEFIEHLFNKHAIGDKAGENKTYLNHTLKKARLRFEDETSPNPSGAADVQENECAWFVERNGKQKQVSTFVFYPDTIIRGGAGSRDVYVGKVCTQFGTEYNNVRLRHSDFVGVSSMADAIPYMDCAWLGSDTDLRMLLPYLFNQFREGGGIAKELREQVGYYKDCWIGTSQIVSRHLGGVIPEDDSLIMYDNRKDEGNVVRLEYDFDISDIEDFVRFFELVPMLNNRKVMSTAIGWLAASIFKSRLETVGYRFPFLNVSGTRGAGKTTLLKEVMQPLVGYLNPRTYDCSTTKFVLLSLLGSSTDVFISLSEFRKSAMSDTNDRNLQRYLLLGYDSGMDPRGRANQTIKNYELTAPVTIDGEDMVDDPALLERSIHIRMSPEDITNGSEDAFNEFTSLNLNQVGSQMILFSLSYDFETAIHWCEEFGEQIQESLGFRIPARPWKNVMLVLFGVRFFEDFAEHVGCTPVDFGDYKDIIMNNLSLLIDTSSGRTRRAVDDFVEDIVLESDRMITEFTASSFPFLYDKKTNILRFHMAGAYSWWRKHRRQQGLPSLEKRSIEAQLVETVTSEAGSFILPPSRSRVSGSILMLYGIDLTEASKVLDIPSTLVELNITMAKG